MTLALQERKAWELYLHQVRSAVSYEAVEPWAWAELQATLLAIHRKRPHDREAVHA